MALLCSKPGWWVRTEVLFKQGQLAVHLCGERKVVQWGLYKQSHLWNVQNVHRGCARCEGSAGSWGAQGRDSKPMRSRLPGQRNSQMQPMFSALADVSGLGLNVTKVIRYQCGQYYVLFNATKIIINKTVNISPVPSYPSLKIGKTPAIVSNEVQARHTVKGKEETSYHLQNRLGSCSCCFVFFPHDIPPFLQKTTSKNQASNTQKLWILDLQWICSNHYSTLPVFLLGYHLKQSNPTGKSITKFTDVKSKQVLVKSKTKTSSSWGISLSNQCIRPGNL